MTEHISPSTYLDMPSGGNSMLSFIFWLGVAFFCFLALLFLALLGAFADGAAADAHTEAVMVRTLGLKLPGMEYVHEE